MTAAALPVCVDCDGTLIHTDLLHEATLKLARQSPWLMLALPFWLLRGGKAGLKLQIARRVQPDATVLPYDQRVLDHLARARADGRAVYLVTASVLGYAQAIADHLQLFDGVIATTEDSGNLSGETKRAALVTRFGEGGYEYLGNAMADVPSWNSAATAVLVNGPAALADRLSGDKGFAQTMPKAERVWPTPLLRAIRVHQWLKNLLVFTPVLTAHRLGDGDALFGALLAFIAFSLCASSVYLTNDLFDIESDRHHPRKRLRPFAAGTLSIPAGVVAALTLLAAAMLFACMLPWQFGAVLAVYYLTTLSYSLRLKAEPVVDVLLLSGLYTVRILAGSAATGIVPSFWLLAFSLFIFLSLALVKRYAEMLVVARSQRVSAMGRGYTVNDMPVLLGLGIAAGLNSVLVLALYINSPEVQLMYRHPRMLWLMVPLLGYWIARVWLKTQRDEMHDDPVIFAVRDWQSLIIGCAMLTCAALGRS
jgi:4-hydroxybenzoate polyprenyltransferase